MLRSPTLNPCSPHCSIAASRIRAMAVRSSDAERMFSTLNVRSAEGQAPTPSEMRKGPSGSRRGVAWAQFAKEGRSVAGGGEQAVAKRDEHRSQPLVLGDQPGSLTHGADLGVLCVRVAGAPAERR